MATIDLPFNPDLTVEDVHRALRAGLPEREIAGPEGAMVVVRRGTAQVTVELLQQPDSTRLLLESQAHGFVRLFLSRSTAYLATLLTRENLEKEVFAVIRQRLMRGDSLMSTPRS
jgi:hypothetical protein